MLTFSNILSPKSFLGISLIIEEGSVKNMSYCLLKQRGEGLHIEDHKFEVRDYDLNQFKNIPIVVNISGQGVITKAVSAAFDNNRSLIDRSFPGLDQGEFYIQYAQDSFCSIIRKDLVNKILLELNSMGNVVGVVLNHFAVLEAKNLIKNSTVFSFSNMEFSFTDKNVTTVISKSSKNSFDVDGIQLQDEEFSAFSAAYQMVLNEDAVWVEGLPLDSIDEFIQKSIFHKLKIGVPLLLLTVLLINFFLFSKFYSENIALNDFMGKNGKLIFELDSLKSQVEIKENYLNSESWFSSSKNSFYLDRLATTIPKEISLISVNVSPQIENESSNTLEFNKNEILIEAKGESTIDVNSWVHRLDNEYWVDDHEILGLSQEKNNGEVGIELVIYVN